MKTLQNGITRTYNVCMWYTMTCISHKIKPSSPLITPLRSPGIAGISVTLFASKYSSQDALRWLLLQKMFHSSVVTVWLFTVRVFAHVSNMSLLKVRFPSRQTLHNRIKKVAAVVIDEFQRNPCLVAQKTEKTEKEHGIFVCTFTTITDKRGLQRLRNNASVLLPKSLQTVATINTTATFQFFCSVFCIPIQNSTSLLAEDAIVNQDANVIFIYQMKIN